MGPKKCLIMWSERAARETIQMMGLDPNEWAPRFYFDNQTGRRWHVIAVVQPPDGWKNCHYDWIDTNLKTATNNLVLL